MSIRFTRGIALLGACALWAACSKSGKNADSAAAKPDSSASAQAAAPSTPAAAAPATLSDTNIFALLDEANAADSSGGALASTKGTAGDVKAFGKEMVKDHHAMRKEGQDLAKKLAITPTPPSNDTLQSSAQKMMDSLNAQTKGVPWDKAYIDHAVAAHQGVLSMLQNFQSSAKDTSLKALITKAIPKVQDHLKKAQDIQSKLSNTSTTGADSGKAGTKPKTAAKKP